jgi:hypothetical protein
MIEGIFAAIGILACVIVLGIIGVNLVAVWLYMRSARGPRG